MTNAEQFGSQQTQIVSRGPVSALHCGSFPQNNASRPCLCLIMPSIDIHATAQDALRPFQVHTHMTPRPPPPHPLYKQRKGRGAISLYPLLDGPSPLALSAVLGFSANLIPVIASIVSPQIETSSLAFMPILPALGLAFLMPSVPFCGVCNAHFVFSRPVPRAQP
ncbi:uncharacterized protein VTP21DRAFT_1876 [Calcarisporiella thermophila]|uniref:uncharacterized protein n=1 Tax=Calcarisporiella thermophila TaxID=911321 RepID=UPI0037436EA7